MNWIDIAAELKFDKKTPWTKMVQAMQEQGYDLTYDQVRTALRRHPRYKKDVIFEDRKTFDVQDVETYIGTFKALQQAQEKLNTKQVKATISIPDDKPIGIAWWGDWHIGAVGTDYEQFEKDLELIEQTEGLYWIGAGDYKDNYISGTHVGANFEQVIQPGMQDMVVKHYMEKAGDKCLALVRGCHDSWDKKQGDKDFISTLCELADCVNLWHGGDILIKLGSQEYLWRLRHKYKYESSLNLENSMRRINEIKGPCDVAAVAHLHEPYIMDRHLMGEYRIMMRSGTYKVWDEFGQQVAGYKGKIGVPVVILYPNERKVVGNVRLEDGIEALKRARI